MIDQGNVDSPQAEWDWTVDTIIKKAVDCFMPKLSVSAWKVLSAVIYHTLILHRRDMPITYTQFQKMCGKGVQSSATISRAIKELLDKRYLIRVSGRKPYIYAYHLHIPNLIWIASGEAARARQEQERALKELEEKWVIQEAKRKHTAQKRSQFQAQRAQIVPEVLQRDNYRCRYCGTREHLTLDHIVPLSKGGHPTDLNNLIVACQSCNSRKKDHLPAEAGLSFQG